jgi:L-2,4-diaminobutyrate decarboxylase
MTTQVLDETLAAIQHDMSDETGRLFASAIAAYLLHASRGDSPVTTRATPEEIRARFAEPLPTGRRSIAEVVARLERDVVRDAIKLVHPRYMGVSVAPPLPAAVWSEALIAAMNQSLRASVMSPTITPLEHQLIRWLTERIGFTEAAGGTLTSGGTEANFTALLAARAAIAPDAWDSGLGSEPPIVLLGDNAHDSVTRAVAQLGLGARRAVRVPLRDHRIDTDALACRIRDARAAGTRIMAVVATAASSSTGSFDDIDTIGAICKDHAIWLHVDGAHGASALLSDVHRHRLRGIERAHSVTWDAHKMMLLPLPAGAVLVRDAAWLDRAFAPDGAAQGAAGDGSLGPRSFMTSRRADALKLWIGLLRYGADGLAAIYDHLCELTMRLHAMVSARGDLASLHVPQCNLLCFRYVGDGVLDPPALDLVNRELHDRFRSSGRGFIATVELEGRFALRVTIMNPLTREQHLHDLLEDIATTGNRVVAERH